MAGTRRRAEEGSRPAESGSGEPPCPILGPPAIATSQVENVGDLEDALVKDTLSTICKYEGDLRKAEKELSAYVQRKRAERERAETAPPATGDKDVLH